MGDISRTSKLRPGRKKVISVVAAIGIVASMCGGVVRSATTISPTYPGNLVRENSIAITTNPVAVQFARSGSSTSNFVRSTVLTAACAGDDPAGTNNSPRTIIDVIGPGTTGVVFNAVSPAIRRDLTGAFAGYPVLNPQPAPNNTNFRGGAHGSTVSGAPSAGNATRPWTVSANLEGQPAGTYTVRTTTNNMVRPGSVLSPGACTVGTPPLTSASTFGNTFTPGPVVEEQTFEYRPWQHVFKDVFGGGRVNLNVSPKEFQAAVANQSGSVHQADTTMTLYQLPELTANFMLPSDPAGCAANPQSCLPAAAVECLPDAVACTPDVAIVNKGAPGDILQGVFDLNAHAFIARANVNGYQRVLLSLGTKQDAAYRSLLNQLAAQASAQGVDLLQILGTTVRVRLGGNEITLSLLNGLQIQPKAAGVADGVQIVSDFTAQAGLILDIFARIGGTCTATAGDSNPDTPAPDRYAHTSDVGYVVEKSDLLPDVPRVGPAGALVGGPIYHIEGHFGDGSGLVNTAAAVIGVDTAANEPNGYPIWVEPFVSTPTNVTAPRTMDFIGTATWSASETNLGALGCLTVDFMLGAGVALYNNPLDVGFGDIPIWDPASPAVAALIDQIDAAVQDAADQVASNPTVAALLEQITGLLPETDLPV